MTDSARDYHKPVRRPADQLDNLVGAGDPAHASHVAHATAHALLTRARAHPEPEVLQRLVGYTREHGIDEIAQLWAHAPAHSLPGALWRLYLLQLMVHRDAATSALLYDTGTRRIRSADPVIAGAPPTAGPDELARLVDEILRGAFTGDFAVALERAASFCRVEASGATHVADDYEPTEPARATALTARALRLSSFASELSACAVLWRRGDLD